MQRHCDRNKMRMPSLACTIRVVWHHTSCVHAHYFASQASCTLYQLQDQQSGNCENLAILITNKAYVCLDCIQNMHGDLVPERRDGGREGEGESEQSPFSNHGRL